MDQTFLLGKKNKLEENRNVDFFSDFESIEKRALKIPRSVLKCCHSHKAKLFFFMSESEFFFCIAVNRYCYNYLFNWL